MDILTYKISVSMKNIFNVEVWIYPDNLKVTRGHKPTFETKKV